MPKRAQHYYILDADNRPVRATLLDACTFWENDSNRIVNYTQINSEILVSTVFLFFDHRLFGEGPPLLFETIIFGGPLDREQWRYSSHDDAMTGHAAAVRIARATAKPAKNLY